MNYYEDYDDYEDYADYIDPDLARHKRTDKIKWILTAAAFLLVAVMLVGLCLQCFGSGKQKPSEWFAGDGKETSVTDGLLVSGTESNGSGIALTSMVIPVNQYAAYGVSPIAESAQTVTASFKDYDGDPLSEADTARIKLTWTPAWKSTNGWGKGKTVTEYVTVSVNEDTHTATLSCLQAFGEQIILTATVNGDSGVSNSVTVDYKQRYSSWKTTIKFPQNALTVNFGENLAEHASRFTTVDYPAAFESMTFGTTGGTVKFSVIGTDVYTIPLDFTVGGCKTKCASPNEMKSAGARVYEDFTVPIGVSYDPSSHTWSNIALHSLLGLTYENDSGGFTMKKYRSALAKTDSLGFGLPMNATTFQFTDVNVNGQPVTSSDNFQFTVAFSANSVYVSASSVEFDHASVIF